MLEIFLDSHIHIKGLSEDWVIGLSRLCAFENEYKEVAEREFVWGAERLDDQLTLANYENGILTLPRGFWDQVKEYLNDVAYEFHDNRVYKAEEFPLDIAKDVLRSDQLKAFFSLHDYNQGRIIAPPGKGKTVIALAYLNAVKTKALILVDKVHIAQQWVDRGKEHFDMDIGFIGDQKWDEKDITVALIQTLNKREKVCDEDDWWQYWDCVMLDEQHHIPAETYTKIISKFPAKKRFGLSATIGKSEAKKKVSELIFGPILYEDTETQIIPRVEVIPTGFKYEFTPTTKIGNRVIRNNYKTIIKDLTTDLSRNYVIANNILKNKTHCQLIVSDRLVQLDLIEGLVTKEIRTYRLTGKESLEKRMEVYQLAAQGKCAIFSTVASEALDIPRIDRIHMVFPRKNEEAIWQIIGRGTRPHPDKTELIVYDYIDGHTTGPLYKQYRNRLTKLYKPKGFTIVKHK